MAKTNIETFVNPDGTPGHVFNIVKGCNGPDGKQCSYCYGCKIVKQFGYAEMVARKEMEYKYNISGDPFKYNNKIKLEYIKLIEKIKQFKPHFFEYVYAQKLRKKPTMYFFSMSDPADWKQEWYERIVEKIAQHMQHTFVVLTKRPWVYEKYSFPINTWLGVTTITQKKLNEFECQLSNRLNILNKLFLSIEPIQEIIKITGFLHKQIDWIIVGPETGTQKKTPAKWLEPFFDLNIPVFMKDSCSKIIDRPLRQEMPEGYKR
jgi:protein gp37